MTRVSEDIGEVDGTLVVPSRQRAEALRLAQARAQVRRGRQVWASPDILPADAWLSREIEAAAAAARLPRLLSGAQEWLIWRQCAAEFTDHLDLISRGALADGLRHASELAREYGIALSALAGGAAGSEGRLLYEVWHAVEARHAAQEVTTARALAGELACLGDARAVEFAGFLGLPPYLQAVSRRRQVRGYPTSTRPPAVAERRARKVLASDRSGELQEIASWCRALLEEEPHARTLIVLPGPPALRERLATLVRQSLDPRAWLRGDAAEVDQLVAVEGGEALARAPMVAHALAGLSVLTRATPFIPLSAWLCAPYWRHPHAAGRARLDAWLRAAAPLALDLPALLAFLATRPPARHAAAATAARELAARLKLAAAHLDAPSGTPREWAARIRAALEALEWPGDALRTSEAQQTLERFNELLNEFGELTVAVRTLARHEALELCNDLAVHTPFRGASGDALVTVTAFLEDPVVHYAGIWVAGVDAGSFPQPVQMNPFVPFALQRATGIPAASAAGRTAEARALMLAWREGAQELVFSVAQREEDLELMPSPLLDEWAAIDGARAPRRVWLPARLHRQGQLESLIDATGPAWPVAAPLPAGTRMLELQSQCAFHAFGEVRLGSRALEAPEPGVGARERGTFLHAALERLWRSLKGSNTLQELSPAALAEMIAASVAAAAGELWGGALARARRRECARARRLLAAAVDVERTRAPFAVRAIEFDSALQLCGARLDLRIDRIDALADGGLAVLDYKSGAHHVMDWFGEHLSHPQLLAYVAALGAEVRAVATVNVAAKEVRFHGVAEQTGLLPKVPAVAAQAGMHSRAVWEQARQYWQQRIAGLVQDFLDGRAAVDPAPRACENCDVASLCRIAERAQLVVQELEAAADD